MEQSLRRDKSEGAILGAFIADSIGSFVEFKRVVTISEAKLAM
jgi:ADP-ribosylglycohydrolase